MNSFDYHKNDTTRDTLMFLHGSSFNRAMWQPQIKSLKDEYSLLALDLPGHGALEKETFTLDAAVTYVADVISSETNGKVVTVGLSLGGYVALAHAAKYPDQVSGLVLSGSSVQYFGLIGLLAKANVFLLRLLSSRRFNQMQKKMLQGMLPRALAEEVANAGFSLKGGRDSMREVIGKDFLSMLKKYPGPVLMINGQNDKINRRYESRIASAANASVEVISNCGHLCNLEQPDAFSSLVRQFAQRVFLDRRLTYRSVRGLVPKK